VAFDCDGRVLPPEASVVVANWEYQGRGYSTFADAWLSRSLGEQTREMRRVARQDSSAVA
jgi:hypothetical protein